MTTEPRIHRAFGFVFRLEPAAADWVIPKVLDRLDGLRDVEGATVVKTNAVRTVLRVPLPEAVLYVKRYHVRGIAERLKYLVVPSRATAEWRAARALVAAGLPSVRAVMTGEKRRAGFLADGCFASEEIPGGMDLVPYIHEHLWDGGETAETRRHDLLDGLARLVREFHDRGFRHHDLHGGNLLVTGEPGESRIHFIDLHTVKIGGAVAAATRRRNLAKLMLSLTTGTREGDFLRFLTAYEGSEPSIGGAAAALESIAPRIEALERRRVISRTKRCRRRSSSFDLARRGPYRVIRRREVDVDRLLELLPAHDASMAAGGPAVLKDSHRSAISRQAIGDRPVVVKETRCRGKVDALKNLFRPARGLASWVNGNGLNVRKARAATPLAVIAERCGPLTCRTWLVMEDLVDWTRLDLFALARYAGPLDAERREEKRRLVRAFGGFVANLHRREIYHGDLKAVNAFVRLDEAGEPEFRLVDYDRVTFDRPVNRRRRIKNLAQIAASVAVLVTKTDRLRFFRAYAFDDDARENEKEYNRGVVADCAKKIVVTMDPIE